MCYRYIQSKHVLCDILYISLITANNVTLCKTAFYIWNTAENPQIEINIWFVSGESNNRQGISNTRNGLFVLY